MPSTSTSAESVTSLLRRGVAFQQQKRIKEAELCYQTILRQHPDHPEANNLMGMLFGEIKQTKLAIDHFKRAVSGDPKNPAYRNNLGNAYLIAERFELALAELQRSIKRQPSSYTTLLNLGRLYRKLNQADRGLPYLEKAARLHPERHEAKINLAESLAYLGRMDEAAKYYRELLAQNPDSPLALAGLALARKFETGGFELQGIEKLLANGKLSEKEFIVLHHAAGKICSDIKDHDRAFEHFAKSKEIAAKGYSVAGYGKAIDSLIRTFTSFLFAEHKATFGISSEVPVFIVGMPRSGTTLVEQIAASHPQVFGAGELPYINQLATQLKLTQPGSNFLPRMTAAMSQELAGDYLRMIKKVGNDALRITDKMPHNFQYLGLIALLFPKARIIHCTRDPMDNCVSCFTNSFSGSHGYNADLHTLGLYYREYRRLMDHWRRVLPLPMLEVDYQEMIADQEAQSRRLIDFLGLEWHPACLNFHETERTVQTVSRWQVRQPIYKTSVKRWKVFEKHLGPLKEALGELAVD